MSKETWEDGYEMKAEYDFSNSVRSPYATLAGTVHLVTLDEDVHAAFSDSQSVNESIRILMKTAPKMS